MKKQNILKSLILVLAMLLSIVESYASASAVQTFTMSVPPSVAITKGAFNQSDVIEPERGRHSGLEAYFNIEANGTDDDFIIVVGAKIASEDSTEESAFTNDGLGILFGRVGEDGYMPTSEAIADARVYGSNNPNVIVYPNTLTIDSPMTLEFKKGLTVEENTFDGFQVLLNNGAEGTLHQIIDGNPVSGTYLAGPDMAGTYRAVVYVTAIGKN